MYARFPPCQRLPCTPKKLDQGAELRPPKFELCLTYPMPIISSQSTSEMRQSDKEKILFEVKTFFDKMHNCNMPQTGLTIETDALDINICSSIDDIIRHLVCKVDLDKRPIDASVEGMTCNNDSPVSFDDLLCTANSEALSSKNAQSDIPYDSALVKQEKSSIDLPTLEHMFIENVKYIEEKIANQLFSPIKIGRTEPRFHTFIQLDSGASTNLMGMEMARHLNDNNLVNFVYPSSKTILTDVQHNEIAQPLKPINVTLLFDKTTIEMPFHILRDLEYPLLGLTTMIDNKMSIINEEKESYLTIGNVTQPKSIIRTVRNIENELKILGDTMLHPGINLVKCSTQIPSGELHISDNKEWLDTCLHITNQSA